MASAPSRLASLPGSGLWARLYAKFCQLETSLFERAGVDIESMSKATVDPILQKAPGSHVLRSVSSSQGVSEGSLNEEGAPEMAKAKGPAMNSQATADGAKRPTAPTDEPPGGGKLDERDYPLMESSDEDDVDEGIKVVESDEWESPERPPGWTSRTAVWKGNLAKYVLQLKGKGYEREFNTIAEEERKNTMQCAVARNPANRTKNRYSDVLAYDNARVVLENPLCHEGEGYINASFVDGYKEAKAYISTQGPLQETIPDFWQMIWEQRTACVVMATRLRENSRIKCDQYWPEAGETVTYGQFKVTNLRETWSDDHESYVVRVLQLSQKGQSQTREVTHYHLMSWPDHGIPKGTTYVLEILKQMRQHQTEAKARFSGCGPVAVHCSAGIGRTGVLIAIDICRQSLEDCGWMDLLTTVVRLRQQRVGMVQTLPQYQFCYQALLESVRGSHTPH